MGINSGGYSNTSLPVLSGANTAYLYATGTDFVIGNGTATRPIRFFTGGFATTNERLRIDGTGRVGVNNTAPTEALDVTGNVKFSGALMPNNAAGTAGYVLQSNGAGAAPTWVSPTSANSWSITGNANTTAGTNFIGTTNAQDLVFKTNNAEGMRLLNGGGVEVDAGSAQTTLSLTGDVNNYLEVNIQNVNNGATASTDIVATANNGSGSSVYVDLGINSQGYSNTASNILNGSNVAYLYAHGRDFKIGNGTPARHLIFFTNPTGGTQGTNTANGVERLRITEAGRVGIGTDVPGYLLEVNGTAGKPGGGSWSTASDRRLKTDISSFADGLGVLMKINPVWFKYNGLGGMPNDGKKYVGIIAQEMQEIAPYTIGTFKDASGTDYFNYDPNAVLYILINAVQEQQVMLDELQKRVQELENKLLR